MRSVAFSPDGRLLAVAGDINRQLSSKQETAIKIWNTQSGSLQQMIGTPDDQVRTIAFSTSGRWLASGAYGDTVKIWNVKTGALLRTFSHSDVGAVALSPDEGTLATASDDGKVRLWSLREDTP